MGNKSLILILAIIPILSLAQSPGVGHGGTCGDDEGLECAPGLSCLYKTCSCLTGQGFQWDAINERCVGRVGSPCENSSECAGNSTCSDVFCQCNSGFSRNRNAICKSQHGEKCSSNADCNEDVFLFCNDQKICTCVDDTVKRLFRNGFCQSLVGQPCDPHEDYFGFPNGPTGNKCIQSSVCQKEGSGYSCACPSGLQVLADNTCGAPSGHSGARRWSISLLFFFPFFFYPLL